MLRLLVLLTIAGLLLSSCGPDHRQCSGPHPDFVVLLKLSDRPLPPDTVVKVTYGGAGTESYDLAHPSTPEVVFCGVSPKDKCVRLTADGDDGDDGDDAAGAAGAAGSSGDESGVTAALCCELWTGGYTTVQVEATGLDGTIYELTPDDSQCTVSKTIVLDSPDAG